MSLIQSLRLSFHHLVQPSLQPIVNLSSPDKTGEEVRQRALRLQDLFSRFEDGEFPSLHDFYTACRATGASNAEILDYSQSHGY